MMEKAAPLHCQAVAEGRWSYRSTDTRIGLLKRMGGHQVPILQKSGLTSGPVSIQTTLDRPPYMRQFRKTHNTASKYLILTAYITEYEIWYVHRL
jgi:hypothetical protein